MNILYLAAYFQPESVAYSYIEKDLLSAFTKDGNDVFVICPTPCRGCKDEDIQTYKKKKQEELYDGHVHVKRFWAPLEGKNPLIRAFRYFWCNIRMYQIARKYSMADVIFSNSTPPTQGLICAFLKKAISKKYKKRIGFVYNVQDVFPDSMINTGLTKENSLVWRMGRTVEDYTYKLSDKIVVISDGFKKNLMDKGVSEDKIVVVPNWPDITNIYPIERADNKLISRHGLDPNLFYIVYSGNIGHTQNMDMLLDASKKIGMDKKLKDVRFVVIGDGVEKRNVEKRIEEERINNVILLPFQPYDDIAHVFSLGDVGLIISKEGVGRNSVPSKTWGIMAAGRPILASFDKDSNLSRLLYEKGCGIIAEADDENAFVDAVHTLINSDLDQMSSRCKKYIFENVNINKNISEYLATIKEVCV